MKSLREVVTASAILCIEVVTGSLPAEGEKAKPHMGTLSHSLPEGQQLAVRVICANEVTHTEQKQPGQGAGAWSSLPLTCPGLLSSSTANHLEGFRCSLSKN